MHACLKPLDRTLLDTMNFYPSRTSSTNRNSFSLVKIDERKLYLLVLFLLRANIFCPLLERIENKESYKCHKANPGSSFPQKNHDFSF